VSVILLPDKWRRQPTGPVELNNGPFAERLAAAALPASGGIVRTYSRGKLVEQVAWPSGSGISIAGGIGGLGVHAPTSTTHSLRLHSTANQTNTAWEAPSAAGTWLAVFVRYGNVVGNACIFANASAVVPPYTAWGLFDAGGTGSLRTECTAGGSYQYNDFGTMSNNLLYVVGGRYNGANLTTFANGVFSTPTACTGSLVYPDSADRVPTLGNYYEYTPEDRSFNGQIYLGLLWDYALSDAEIIELSQNPWQVFKKSARILYFPSAGGGGATIAGALESLTLSTFGATVGSARDVAAALESLALTTSAATVSSDRAITASVESISLTTSQARIASDRAVSAATEQLTVTPAAASVALVAGIAAGTEALSVTANPATVALNASIAATLEAITVTGLTATVSTSSNTNISAALESITVTVNPATVSRDSALAAALESLTVTPHAASIAVGQIVAAALEGLMLTSYPAGIALDVAIAAQLEQINLATFAAQVGLGTNVAALTEALTLTPHGATLTFAPSVGAATEHLTLTTFAAVVGATEAALLSPGLEFTIPLSRMGYTIPVSRVHFTIPQE